MSESDVRSALEINHPVLSAKWPENTSHALLKYLEWPDFNFRMKGTSWLTEAFNFLFFTGDGSIVFLQIVYSNLAWPNCSAVVNVRFYRKSDGKVFTFQETYMSYKMKRSKETLSVNLADTQLECKPAEVEGEHPTFVYTHKNKDFRLVLEMTPTQKPMQVGHGETKYGAKGSDGYLLFQFVPCVGVKGELQSGQEKTAIVGRGIIIHQFQGVRPNIASTRFDVTYFSQVTNKDPNEIDLFMVQFHTPKRYGGYTINVGFMIQKGRLTALSTGSAEMVGDTVHDEKTGYNLPTQIDYKWSGTTMNEKSFDIDGIFRPDKPVASINVLEHMPFFIRKAVELLVARPHIYKFVDETEFSVRVEGEPEMKVKGSIYHEISFVNKE